MGGHHKLVIINLLWVHRKLVMGGKLYGRACKPVILGTGNVTELFLTKYIFQVFAHIKDLAWWIVWVIAILQYNEDFYV